MDSNSNPSAHRRTHGNILDYLDNPGAAPAPDQAAKPATNLNTPAPLLIAPRSAPVMMGAAMSEAEVVAALRGIARITLIQPVPRHPSDTKGHDQKTKFTTNLMNWNSQAQDKTLFNALSRGYRDEGLDSEMLDALQTANKIVAASGPSSGLFARFRLGYTYKTVPPAMAWVAFARKTLLFDSDRMVNMADKELRELLALTDYNIKSSAGLPWRVPKYLVVREAYEAGYRILEAISAGKLKEFMNDETNSVYFTALLRNKMDRYEISEISNKIRPYYSFSFALTMLFSTVQQQLHKCFIPFWEDPRSCCAIGLSWQNGGAHKIVDWLRVNTTPGFYGLAYGDDQLWEIVVEEKPGVKKRYVVAPDVSQMDARHDQNMAKFFTKFYEQVANKKLGNLWFNVLQLNARMDVVTQVVIHKAVAATLAGCNKSGMPGTTDFNQLVSAAIIGFAKDSFARALASKQPPKTGQDVLKFVQTLAKQVATLFGMPFKENTLTLYSVDAWIEEVVAVEQKVDGELVDWPIFQIGTASTKWAFLGFKIAPVVSNGRLTFVPVKELPDLVTSLVTPRNQAPAGRVMHWRMERIRALQALGFYRFPEYSARLCEVFEQHKNQGATPIGENPDDDVEESSAYNPDYSELQGEFPSAVWCFNQFVAPKYQREEPVYQPTGKKVGQGAPPKFAKIDLGSMYDHSKWADAEFAEGDIVGGGLKQGKFEISMAKGASSMAKPTNNPGRKAPLRTAAEKRALAEKIALARDRGNNAANHRLMKGEKVGIRRRIEEDSTSSDESDPDESDDDDYASRRGRRAYEEKSEEYGNTYETGTTREEQQAEYVYAAQQAEEDELDE